MFRKRSEATAPPPAVPAPVERITSVLSAGINWKGQLGGSGGVRIEGTLQGDIDLRGLLVVGETGRVTCQQLRANVVVIAGIVQGDITAERVEIRKTGRVWGNLVTAGFMAEEGTFLRGQVTMQDKVEIGGAVLSEANLPVAEDASPTENNAS